MTHSGYIDWHRVSKVGIDAQRGSTFVYAYWLVDYQSSDLDHGVTLLKADGEHPDWFVNSEHADDVILSVLSDALHPSPNDAEVYDQLAARPLLAAVCLGTAKATYQNPADEGFWWASPSDLTRPGRRLLKELSELYLRTPVIVTFLYLRPMKKSVPGAQGDQATVGLAPGYI